jgi:hypothetical protein
MRDMGRWWVVAAFVVACAACDATPYDHHEPFPQVETRDGSLLSPLRLVTIVPENDAEDAPAFSAFSEGIGASAWWRLISPEYSLGPITSVPTITGPSIAMDMTDHDLFEYIDAIVTSNLALTPDGHTLYLLYLPQSVEVISDGETNTDCSKFGAYHIAFGVRGDNLAIVQRCTEAFPIENMTVSASHEIFESATDPDGHGYRLPPIAAQTPWTETVWNAFDLTGGAELADLCEGTFWTEGTSVYQRVWSNIAAKKGGDPCVPALLEPFYDTTFGQDWYAVPKGGSVTIPVTGWSTAQLTWPVSTFVEGDRASFAATFPSTSNSLTPGGRLDLSVTAPADAQSGTFTIIQVLSERPNVPDGTRGLTDGAHINYVGVYVP